MPKRLTKEEVDKRFINLYNGEYKLLSEYKTTSTKSIILHKTCGKSFIVERLNRFFNIDKETPCPYCRKSVPITKEEFPKLFKEKYPTIKITEFTKLHGPIKFTCLICNTEFSLSYASDSLKNGWRGCPVCNVDKKGKYQQIPNYLESLLKNEPDYNWLEEYKGNRNIKHKIYHSICGHEYEVRPSDFMSGYRCPYCARKRSHMEIDLAEFVKNNYSGIVMTSDRTQINPYELDIYLPEKNIAIEFNGLYWHSTKQKEKDYDYKKYMMCYKKGIQLITVFEDEWVNNRKTIERRILSYINNTISIYECKFKNNKVYYKKNLIGEFVNNNGIYEFIYKKYKYRITDIIEFIRTAGWKYYQEELRWNIIDDNYQYEIKEHQYIPTADEFYEIYDAGVVIYKF